MDISRWLNWQNYLWWPMSMPTGWMPVLKEIAKRANPSQNNRTPYAPEWLVNGALTLEWINGPGLRILANYTGSQFADELNTVEASADGRIGQIPSFYTLMPMRTIRCQNKDHHFIKCQNLTDERYISSQQTPGHQSRFAKVDRPYPGA